MQLPTPSVPDAAMASNHNDLPLHRVILRSMVLPVGLALVVAVVGASFTLLLPNLYRADVKILPHDPTMDRGLAALAAFAALSGGAGLGGASADPDAINADIVQSRWMLGRILDANYEFTFKKHLIGPLQHRKQTLMEFLDLTDRERAEKKVKEMLTIRRDIKTGLTIVEVETASPELSMQIANQVAINLNQFLNRRSQENGKAKVRFTEQMLFEARQQLAEIEGNRLKFLRENLNASFSPDPAVATKYRDLDRAYTAASGVVQALENNKVQAQLQEKNDVPTLTVLDWARVPSEKSGPRRSIFVLALFFLTGASTWLIRNWEWINRRLRMAEGLPADARSAP